MVGAPDDEVALSGPNTWSLRHPAAEAVDSDLPAELMELVTAWPDDIVDLHVAPGFASATWPLAEPAPRVADATRARELLDRLLALRAALDADPGLVRATAQSL